MIYVLACPRSATKAAHARKFEPGVLKLKHEQMGPDGCVGFPWKGVHDFDLPTFLDRVRTDLREGGTHVIHLVREPLACISSLMTIRPFLEGMAPRLVPGLSPAASPVVKAAALWVHLNDSISALNPSIRWKAEDVPWAPDAIRDSRQHHPDYERVTWARLWLEAPEWAGRAVFQAFDYGYDVSPFAFATLTPEALPSA